MRRLASVPASSFSVPDVNEATVVTRLAAEEVAVGRRTIHFVPAWRWLLER